MSGDGGGFAGWLDRHTPPEPSEVVKHCGPYEAPEQFAVVVDDENDPEPRWGWITW